MPETVSTTAGSKSAVLTDMLVRRACYIIYINLPRKKACSVRSAARFGGVVLTGGSTATLVPCPARTDVCTDMAVSPISRSIALGPGVRGGTTARARARRAQRRRVPIQGPAFGYWTSGPCQHAALTRHWHSDLLSLECPRCRRPQPSYGQRGDRQKRVECGLPQSATPIVRGKRSCLLIINEIWSFRL